MRKSFLKAFCAAIPLLAIGGGFYHARAGSRTHSTFRPVSEKVTNSIRSKKSAPLKTIARDNYFFEDFEEGGGQELTLPEGWVTTATPGQDDVWHNGTLSADGVTPINGVSGWQYAFILGSAEGASHDSWLFSPKFHLTEGSHYLDFFAYMPEVTGQEINPVLEVYLCSDQTPGSKVCDLGGNDVALDYWTQFVRNITVGSDGDYCIGFRCASPAGANAILLDNVRVSDGENPEIYCDTALDFGTVDSKAGKSFANLTLFNFGNGNLEVSLKESSPELSVEGLPATIISSQEENPTKTVTVVLQYAETGDYEGYLILTTNDPMHPEIRIDVTAVSKEYSVTDYISESFEEGEPNDWDFSYPTFILTGCGAPDGSAAWRSTTSYIDNNPMLGGVGFTTNYVNLGESPSISFWYDAYINEWWTGTIKPVEPENLTAHVYLSGEMGEWDEVYTISPDGPEAHNPVMGFRKVEFSIPQHKNETRRVRIVFTRPEEAPDFDLYIDNVKIGTIPDNDIALNVFEGPAAIMKGEKADFNVTAVNNGSVTIENARLVLKDNVTGESLACLDCPAMEGHAKQNVEFSWTPSEARYYHLTVEAEYDDDPNTSNNVSYPIHASVLDENNTAIHLNEGEKELVGASYPLIFNSRESQTQTIYYANELGIDKGSINSVSYTSILDKTYLSDNFSFYVAETDKEDFSDGQFVDDSKFTKVFEGRVYFREGTNDLVIPFDRPFDYKGGNLVIMTRRKADNFMYGVNFKIIEVYDPVRSIQSQGLFAGDVFGNPDASVYVNKVYPETEININYAPYGSFSGVVRDEEGNPVEGAKVRVKGTKLYAVTDASGNYTLPSVSVGTIVLEANAHDYYANESEPVNLEEGQSENIDIVLKKYPLVNVTGKVTGNIGSHPIQAVSVGLKGYNDYWTITDENGEYRIENVTAGTDREYEITFNNPYFKPARRNLEIKDDTVENECLEAKPSKPSKIKTETDEKDECALSWDAPLPEYSHDSGVPSEFVGWDPGWNQVIAGAAFHAKAEIREVSWYCASAQKGHANFNVIIFGLDPEGNPNKNNILYMAENVDHVDDAWSTHQLTRRVTADGFMVAISCDGFMNIGVCEPTEETPFAVGQNYYAGDSYIFHISDMSTYRPAHFMIRAYGKDLGEWSGSGIERDPVPTEFAGKPAPQYNVYRFTEGTPENEWKKVATTSETTFNDPEFSSLEKGKIYYAVKAQYDDEESIGLVSAVIDKEFGGIINVRGNEIRIWLEGDNLRISDIDGIDAIGIYTLGGVKVKEIATPETTVNLNDVARGILIVDVRDKDGRNTKFKVIR